MADLKFEKETTGLLLIDPYNDFISEGGKIWDRIKAVAEANDCVPHMLQLLTGSTLRRFRKRHGREKHLNTERGAASFVRSLHLSRAKSWPMSIGARVALPIPIWIYC